MLHQSTPTDNPTPKGDCAIYGRVSTRGQAKHGFGLQTQEILLKDYAEQQGYRVRYDLTDKARSGYSTNKRDGLEELREAIRSGDITAVFVNEVKRLSRGIGTAIMLWEEMRKYGVKLLSPTEEIEDSDEGTLRFIIRALFGNMEGKTTRRRTMTTKQTMHTHLKVLAHGGIAPFGLKWDHKPSNHPKGKSLVLVEDDKRSPFLRRMFLMADNGMSNCAIARWLTENDVPTPMGYSNIWYPRSVKIILENPVYIGQKVMNRDRMVAKGDESTRVRQAPEDWVEVPDCVDQLIDGEQWQRVQERGRTRAAKYGSDRVPYLLTNHAHCECGSSYTGSRAGGTRRYGCGDKKASPHQRRGPCCTPSMLAEYLEDQVMTCVIEMLADEELVSARLKELREHASEGQDAVDLASFQQLKSDNDDLIKEAVQDSYDIKATKLERLERKQIITQLRALNEDYERNIARLEASIRSTGLRHVTTEEVMAWCEALRAGAPHFTWETKRRILMALTTRVEVSGTTRSVRVTCILGEKSRAIESRRSPYSTNATFPPFSISRSFPIVRQHRSRT